MKSSTRYLALLFLLILLNLAGRNDVIAQQHPSKLGTAFWKNLNPHSSVISKLFIDAKKFQITAYEDCYAGDCSWDPTTLRKTGNVWVATYHQDFTSYELNFRFISPNKIYLLAKTQYRDSDEMDVLEYFFVRSYEKGKSGGISNK
ncbi:MAG: hypothetical protein AAFR61_13120 [Bacteroidota bacterium]